MRTTQRFAGSLTSVGEAQTREWPDRQPSKPTVHAITRNECAMAGRDPDAEATDDAVPNVATVGRAGDQAAKGAVGQRLRHAITSVDSQKRAGVTSGSQQFGNLARTAAMRRTPPMVVQVPSLEVDKSVRPVQECAGVFRRIGSDADS